MKIVNLKDNNQKFDVIRIENLDDLLYIETLLFKYSEEIMRDCLNSGEPAYRYNHIGNYFKGIKNALFVYCVNMPKNFSVIKQDWKYRNTNPLFLMKDAVTHYQNLLLRLYKTYGNVNISLDGGGMFHSSPTTEIIKETEIDCYPDEELTLSNFKKSIFYEI